MKNFLFLLVAVPLSAESMQERTGRQLPQRRHAQPPPLSRVEEETLAALQLSQGGRSQSPVDLDQQPRLDDIPEKIAAAKNNDKESSCCEECARIAGLVVVSAGLSIVFAWLKDYSKKTD